MKGDKRMDYRMRRIIIYGIGSLIVGLWAIFRIIPYFLAMLMTAIVLSIALIMEAEHARIHHEDKKHHFKMFLALSIVVLCTLLIIFEYS